MGLLYMNKGYQVILCVFLMLSLHAQEVASQQVNQRSNINQPSDEKMAILVKRFYEIWGGNQKPTKQDEDFIENNLGPKWVFQDIKKIPKYQNKETPVCDYLREKQKEFLGFQGTIHAIIYAPTRPFYDLQGIHKEDEGKHVVMTTIYPNIIKNHISPTEIVSVKFFCDSSDFDSRIFGGPFIIRLGEERTLCELIGKDLNRNYGIAP